MALVLLGIGLTVVVALIIYRGVQRAKRNAAERSARHEAALREAAAAIQARLERARQAEERKREAVERKRAVAKTSVDFNLGPQEKALRQAAVDCAHRDLDPVPAFIAHGGAAALL